VGVLELLFLRFLLAIFERFRLFFFFFDGAKKVALEKWRGKKNSFVNMLKVVNTFVELNFEMICRGDDLWVMGLVTPWEAWEGRNQGGSLKIHRENSKEGKLDESRL
jgi:hypothetical protein